MRLHVDVCCTVRLHGLNRSNVCHISIIKYFLIVCNNLLHIMKRMYTAAQDISLYSYDDVLSFILATT